MISLVVRRPLMRLAVALLAISASASGQVSSSEATPRQTIESSALSSLWADQKSIWTSPFRIRTQHLEWLVPFGAVGATLVGTDRDVMRHVSSNPASVRRAGRVSDFGAAGTLAIAAGFYGSGLALKNPQARETGWLAGEAVLNSVIVNAAIHEVTRRERPNAATRPGEWWRSGRAFTSDHSMATWSAATVIANEYPGIATKLLAYGTATSVAVSRVLARQHSPSDVFFGSAIGYLIGRQVYRSHRDETLAGARLGTFESASTRSGLRPIRSTFVPIDSNVYALIDRLAAMGYIDSTFLGQRPWTRKECARLVEEARAGVEQENDATAQSAFEELRAEFAEELNSQDAVSLAHPVEFLYVRGLGISGTPLRDDYHFGRTFYNDYGRPYWEGANAIAGASGSVAMGPLDLHMRGEYQYSPGGPTYSQAALDAIKKVDVTPAPLVGSANSTSTFRLIDAYVATKVRNVSVTIGKQSLWWGPVASGPWLFSNNPEPIYMGRLALESPITLPWILGYLGPMKLDGFFGKLAGHRYPRGPYIHGQKISLKPTRNLELGFSRTVMFAGEGRPLTFRSFWNSFSSLGDNPGTRPGSSADVGDRRGGFDFSYRVPGFRDWLTIYGDAFTDSDPSPLSAPSRSAINLGFYLPRLPKLRSVDLRVEAPLTDRAATQPAGGVETFFYYNAGYRDGYTNKGVILGNTVGRNSKGVNAVSRYWMTADRVLELEYRHSTLSTRFVPGGGNYTDASVSFVTPISRVLDASTTVQYERWRVPLLKASEPEVNVSASVMITYRFGRTRKRSGF